MLGIMDQLRNSTRSTYRSIGVVDEENIYLGMDSAGGHGTNEAVLEYSEYLAEKYNIVVHHLDVWCIITNFGRSSLLVVNPIPQPPPRTILHSTQ